MPNETNEAAYRKHVATMDRDRERAGQIAEERAIALAPQVAKMANALQALARDLAKGGDRDHYEAVQKWALRHAPLAPIADYLQDEVFYPIMREE